MAYETLAPKKLKVALRTASTGDLPAVNAVIERAIQCWDLPERVKRLCLPIYTYDAVDFRHLDISVAEVDSIVGVSAWARADERDDPSGRGALLFHGVYVDPAWHGHGIGTQLLERAIAAACASTLGGVLVKAQRGAEGFFRARGLDRLPVLDPDRDYPHRYWRGVATARPGEADRSGSRRGVEPVVEEGREQ